MAGFEIARPGISRLRLQEWRPGRLLPLYVAAVLAGAGLGIGLDVLAGDAARQATQPRVAPAVVDADVHIEPAGGVPFTWPAIEVPAAPGQAGDPGPGALPMEFERALGVFGPAAVGPPPTAAAETPLAPAPVLPAAVPAAPAPTPVQPAAPAQPAAVAPPAKPNFYVPSVPAGPPTALERELFDLINAERAAAGLAPYVLDSRLTQIARTRSQQLIDQGYFGHVDPYGYSMYVELLAYFGITRYAWAGENLAMNNYPADQAAGVALRGLMNSPTHRANLLAGDFTRIGVGLVTDGQGRHFFTMIFLG